MHQLLFRRRLRIRIRAAGLSLLTIFCLSLHFRHSAATDNALQDYLDAPDPIFSWSVEESRDLGGGFRAYEIKLVSQKWREHVWTHDLWAVRPPEVRNPDIALLFISGDRSARSYADTLKALASEAGAVAAVLTRVPNQPLYDGRREDALIAFTFDRFLRTGDTTWPLLFPMVKSAVRAMDALSAVGAIRWDRHIERFVVTGASKRGWTTWLTGAVDPRVVAIAPMVIDVLNMEAHLAWAKKMWGEQSREIEDYVTLGLPEKVDHPQMVRLRSWVDPYAYADRYTIPKLILLGTNDPYWVVDSLRHYWKELPEPKFVFQTPNAGHDLAGGEQAIGTLAAFFQMISDRQPLPEIDWEFKPTQDDGVQLTLKSSPPAENFHVWTAHSTDRDFRDNRWHRRDLEPLDEGRRAAAAFELPERGFDAILGEATLRTPRGQPYRLSTSVQVIPDNRATRDEAPPAAPRSPSGENDLRFWMENMVLHQFDAEEIAAATGLSEAEAQSWRDKLNDRERARIIPFQREKIQLLPYPGGRHPRIGFLDGALRPQRETKMSVFLPWDSTSYLVVDMPEAIWSNLGLTYLAHTHIPTVWSEQEIELQPLEWEQRDDGVWSMERRLPNGIRFGSQIWTDNGAVRMEEWLENGTSETLTDLRVQNCLMLKAADGFNAQTRRHKLMSPPYVACRSSDDHRWIIYAWEPNDRLWVNPPVPCLHSDPKFPDCPPGAVRRLQGWLSFYEGTDIEGELRRIDQTGWRKRRG